MSRRTLYCSKYPNTDYSISKFDDLAGNIRFVPIDHRWDKNGKCKYCGASQVNYSQEARGEDRETHAYVKKAKKTGEDERTPKAKKEISAEEKEIKSKRKEIQEKLIKFATRIPIFMYLSEYREETLKDVITQLEPMLFQRVTGLMVKDFDLLCSMGVFNDSLMNEAVFQFWRYENASLQYAGVNRHAHESHIGGFSTILTRNEYEKLDHLLGISMNEKAFTPAINHREIETPIQIQSQTPSNVPKKQFKQHTHSSETNHVSSTSQTSLSNEKLKHAPLHETDAPFVGQTLVHQVLGKGVVTKIQGEKVSLVFGKIEKTFIYKIALSKGILRC